MLPKGKGVCEGIPWVSSCSGHRWWRFGGSVGRVDSESCGKSVSESVVSSVVISMCSPVSGASSSDG